MRTRDFREILADDLSDPEFRREFIIACFEQDGVDGLHMALDEIAQTDAIVQLPVSEALHSATDLREMLNQMGLDLRIVRLQTTDKVLAVV